MCDEFTKVCEYESTRAEESQTATKVPRCVQKLAIKFLKSESKHHLVKVRPDIYRYNKPKNGTYYEINLTRLSCSCLNFEKYANCYHLTAVALLEKITLRGVVVSEVVERRVKNKKDRVVCF